jgi:hypothetical protein
MHPCPHALPLTKGGGRVYWGRKIKDYITIDT